MKSRSSLSMPAGLSSVFFILLLGLACGSAQEPKAEPSGQEGSEQESTAEPNQLEENAIVPTTSEDWTTFRADPHRLGHRGTSPRLETLQRRWRFDLGSEIESSPTPWRDLVFVGSFSGRFSAVEAATGAERWHFTAGGLIRASPSVMDGMVYFGADDDLFYALDAASGEERWRFSLGPGGEQSSPAIVDGVVYFGAFDHHVYALDAVDGSEHWRYDTGGGILSSPAVVEGVLYIGVANGEVHAVDSATGKRRWLATPGEAKAGEGPIFASPTVADGVVYIGSFDDHMYAFDASDGALRWSFRTGGDVFSSAAASLGRIYFGADDGFYALDATHGDLVWHRPLGGRVLASPAVLEDSGILIVGTSDAGVLIYSFEGELVDRLEIEDKVWSSVSVAPDGTLFFGSHDGFLYAYGEDAELPGTS